MIDLTAPESRYARQELITWWDQSRLSKASVLVVGAGALGNELAKNLALVGLGSITVIDLDTVERSNLSRCVFFTDGDESEPKADVVASGARRLNPELDITGMAGDITRQGLGWVSQFDLVLGGLDNREARVWINQACRKLAIPWIDGAIEGLRAVVRTFLPEGPCYECTLSETDREILAHRKSCALLSDDEIASGKVPTTATTASLTAAVQVQEAIRLLHGEARLANQGWTFIGETLDSWTTDYGEDEYCLAHDRYDKLRSVEATPETTLAEILGELRPDGGVTAVDLEADLVLGVSCGTCGHTVELNRRLVDLTRPEVECPTCGELMAMDSVTSLAPDHPVLDVPLGVLGLPALEVVSVRTATDRLHLCLEGHHS